MNAANGCKIIFGKAISSSSRICVLRLAFIELVVLVTHAENLDPLFKSGWPRVGGKGRPIILHTSRK